MTSPAPLRPAATVVVVRDGGDAPELLMLRRNARSGFAADAWVFPGGVVDAADRALEAARWTGIDPPAVAPRFGDPVDLVLGYHVAAIRETFEEAGLLLARHGDGRRPDVTRPDYVAMRARLGDRDQRTDWPAWLVEEDLVLDLGCLTYLSRWVTPRRERKRYDTAFFVARAPEGQVVAHDRVEVTDQRWLTAADALTAHRSGDLHLIYPTVKTLESLADLGSVDAVVALAERQQEVPRVLPHIHIADDGWRILHPDDPEYPHEQYEEGTA